MSTPDPPPAPRSLRSLVWGIVVGAAGMGLIVAALLAADGGRADTDDDIEPVAAETTASVVTTLSAPATATETADKAGGSVGPTTPTPPPGDPVDCGAPTVSVQTAEQLQQALDAAQPGDRIHIADGTYVGEFVAARSGTEAAPIRLCGGPAAVLDGDSISGGYVLHLQQVSHWYIGGFTVRNGQKGVIADGVSNSIIHGLTVEQIGDEAIHLRSASSNNAVIGNVVRNTGLRRDKFGEGIYVGSATSNWANYSDGGPDRSDYNLVEGNVISDTTSESIDIKEGTTGGRVVGNTMDGSGTSAADSVLDVKGNEWLIEGNVVVSSPEEGMQTHRILEGWGERNQFRNNTIDVVGDGLHVYVHDADITANVVACDNHTASGAAIRSNVTCGG